MPSWLRSAPAWTFPVALAGTLLAVYASAFRYPSFNPEHALYYVLNADLGWWGLVGRYLGEGDGFYRPTALFGYYQLVSALLGWHALYGFKLVSLLLLAAYGVALQRLGLVLWSGDRLAAGLAALFAVSHPINYINIYETVGFDLIYQILVIVCLILYFGPALQGPRRWGAVGLAAVLFAVALTAKEQAVALPGLLLCHAALLPGSAPARRPQRVLALVVTVLGLLFLAFEVWRMGYVDSGPYRTGPNGPQILVNLESGLLWLAHIFVVPNPVWPLALIQNTRHGLVFGLAVLALLGLYLLALARGRLPAGEAGRLAVIAGFLGVFLLLPIYSGGRPWHYGLPLAAFALVQGRALAWLVRLMGSPRHRLALLSTVMAATVILAAVDFARELHQRLWLFRINVEAVRHPPVAAAAMPHGATVLYAVAPDVWSFGVGHLFRLAYLDPSMTELAVTDLATLDEETRQRWLSAPAAFFFVYDPQGTPAWRDCSAEARRRLLAGGVPACPAANGQ